MKPHMKNRWVAGAALIASMLPGVLPAAQEPAPATVPAPGPNAFVVLFSTTCMEYYNSPDKLRVAMQKSGTAEMTGDAAAFFLNHKVGSAWRVPIEGEPYIVALRQDGICTVFAQRAEIETVRSAFTRLVSKATPPVEAHALPGGPTGTGVQTITYAWARPADDVQLVFTLTTSTNPNSPAQAMATVGLTAK